MAGAVTGGKITLTGAPCEHLGAFVETMGRAGVGLSCGKDTIEVDGSALDDGGLPGRRHRDRGRIRVWPPTSSRRPRCCSPRRRAPRTSARRSSRTASSGWASCAGWARTIDIARQPSARSSRGRSRLHGAEVEIGDLRAGASLILAALAADGTTTIHGAHHVHRGYENIEGKFLDLGARIERLAEGNDTTSS